MQGGVTLPKKGGASNILKNELKISTFNIEWMNRWFEGGSVDAFKQTMSDGSSVDQVCQRVKGVIEAIDPDILGIQEGPSSEGEMDLFINKYLTDKNGVPRYKFIQSIDGRSQKIYQLYKPEKFTDVTAYDYVNGTRYVKWQVDIDGDGQLNDYEFTRTPLEVTYTIDDKMLTVIAMHTKSKYIHDGQSLWGNTDTRLDFVLQALQARRRISAEAMRTREAIDDILISDPERTVVILGDMNDGPGRDYFEQKYLTHNLTDIVLGSTFYPERMFIHALGDVSGSDRYTAIFDDFVTGETNKKLLLDHVLYSPNISTLTGAFQIKSGSGQVDHQAFDNETAKLDGSREERPSDHKPISMILKY
jgi:hypothetical protein